MAMTRRQYNEVADIISSRWSDAPTDQARVAVENVASDLASMFKRDNGAFSYTTFFDACGLPVPSRFAGAR